LVPGGRPSVDRQLPLTGATNDPTLDLCGVPPPQTPAFQSQNRVARIAWNNYRAQEETAESIS